MTMSVSGNAMPNESLIGKVGYAQSMSDYGGYYLPSVEQVEGNKAKFSFAPTKYWMAPVEDQTIEIPPAEVDLDGYATEQWVQEGYQPKGDYLTEVPEGYAKTEDLPRKIITAESGDVIVLTDSDDRQMHGLTLYGKTTQNGTPTPEAPVPLESVGDSSSITVNVGISETDEDPQTLTIQKPTDVPVFLPGLKILSDGNYTDSDGQQWVCDEVDFVRGKYVQRIGKAKVSDFSWTSSSGGFRGRISTTNVAFYRGMPPLLSNCYTTEETGSASNWVDYPDYSIGYRTDELLMIKDSRYTDVESFKAGAGDTIIYYVMKEPIEHDLTAEELAQYAALHTNYPNTTIFNDAGAGMQVGYVADTKNYIDKKFNELAAAIVNN